MQSHPNKRKTPTPPSPSMQTPVQDGGDIKKPRLDNGGFAFDVPWLPEEEITDLFSALPEELQAWIFWQFSFLQLRNARAVSKRWGELADDTSARKLKQRISQEKSVIPLTILTDEFNRPIPPDYAKKREQAQKRTINFLTTHQLPPAMDDDIDCDLLLNAARLQDISILIDTINRASANPITSAENQRQFVSYKDIFNRTALHYFAAAGDQLAIKLMLLCGANPQQEDVFNQSPFTYAVQYALKSGDDLSVRRLLKTKKIISHDFRPSPEQSGAPLLYAVFSIHDTFWSIMQHRNVKLLTLLISHGLMPDIEILLSCDGDKELLMPLLNFSSEDPMLQNTFLINLGHYAILINDPEVLATAVEKGLQINIQHIFTAFQASMSRYNLLVPHLDNVNFHPAMIDLFQTCFDCAIPSGDLPAIEFLLIYFNKLVDQQKIDIESQRSILHTWLYKAAVHQQVPVFALLVEQFKKSSIVIDTTQLLNAAESIRYMAFRVADMLEQFQIELSGCARFLLRTEANRYLEEALLSDRSWDKIQSALLHRARPDECTVGRECLLIWAVQHLQNDIPLFEKLFEHIQTTDIIDISNWEKKITALMLAAAAGSEAIVRLLLKRQPDLTRRDALGRTAKDHAYRNGHRKIAALLFNEMENRTREPRTLGFFPPARPITPALPCLPPFRNEGKLG